MAQVQWVHEYGLDWGAYMRGQSDGWPSISIMGRIMEEGEGASIRQHGRSIPIKFMPLRISQFHRAWRNLNEKRQNVILARYVIRASLEERIEALDMSKNTYYKHLQEAQAEIARMIQAETEFGNRIPEPLAAQ